jgi:hypothetical protein
VIHHHVGFETGVSILNGVTWNAESGRNLDGSIN